MRVRVPYRRLTANVLFLGVALALGACGSKEPTAPAPTPAPAETTASAAQPPAAPPTAWSPEALEELLAPIALYPDPVLSQVLIASTNPQEVLDAGNWLIANETLKGDALDEAAARIGFTPPIRALIQFPQTIDMMCMEMGWTTELGQAFVADQAGVLDAVQRLRKQAIDVGSLQTSAAMTVEQTEQEGKEVVVLKPPKPEVVYVPTYDPQAAYAPPPAAAAPAAPTTTTTTTTTTVEDDTRYDSGDMVMTGVLAFGAGILVNEIFDDDDHHGYYYPNYGYGGMPYYPPYPYRPAYGGGYYPSHGYNRPPNYNSGFQNNGNIIINTGGNNQGNYWNRYDDKRPGYAGTDGRGARKASSPITAAKPNRPELAQLNQRPARPMPADVKRPDASTTASNWKGQKSYAGRDKAPAGVTRDPAARIAEAKPGYSSAPSGARQASQRPAPKVQGGYAGKDRRPAGGAAPRPGPEVQPRPASRDVQKPKPATRDLSGGAGGERPMTREPPMQRPEVGPNTRNQQTAQGRGDGQRQRPTAVSGTGHQGGGMDRAASQRGRQSLPQGARSKGAGGGGAKHRGR